MFRKTTNPVAVRLRQGGEDLQVEAADEIDRLQQERDEAQGKIREMVEWLHPAQWAELDRARLKLLGIALGEQSAPPPAAGGAWVVYNDFGHEGLTLHSAHPNEVAAWRAAASVFDGRVAYMPWAEQWDNRVETGK